MPSDNDVPVEVANATRFVTVALGRGYGLRLEQRAQNALQGFIAEGFERATAEGRLDDFSEVAKQLPGQLARGMGGSNRALPPGQFGLERRGHGHVTASRGGPYGSRPVPPESLSEAMRALCPIWPFC